MQITALSNGLSQHLSNILAGETENAAGPQVHPDVQSMLCGDTGTMWSTTLAYFTHPILDADFGTLDKVKDHFERNKSAGEAAQAFVNGLGMAISEVAKGTDDQEGKRLEWPDSLNTAIIGADKKLTTQGIAKLKDPYNMWSLVPICDAACVIPSLKYQKRGAIPMLNRRQGLTNLNRNSTTSRAMSPTLSRSDRSYRRLRSPQPV